VHGVVEFVAAITAEPVVLLYDSVVSVIGSPSALNVTLCPGSRMKSVAVVFGRTS